MLLSSSCASIQFMTLRWRLTLLYTALLSVLLLIVMVSVFSIIQQALETAVEKDLRSALTQVTRSVIIPGNKGNSTYAIASDMALQVDLFGNYSIENLKAKPVSELVPVITQAVPLQVGVFNEEGSEEGIRLSREDYKSLVDTGNVFSKTTLNVGTEKHPFLILTTLREHKNFVGFGPSIIAIYVGKDLIQNNRILEQLRLIMLTTSLYAVVGMGFLAYWLAGRALQPLRAVRKAAAQITEKSLGQRVPVPRTGDEISTLARTLNTMLERLERSFETQRRFTSDASHELRTPVTAIGGHAGYLLRRTNPTEGQKESLQIIKNESERLSQLIASLLELARSDGGSTPLNLQPVLALPFLGELSSELRPIAEAAGAQISVLGPEVEFEADPSRLKQVFINLMANALKAGSSRLYLEVLSEDDNVHFRVGDNGPGIAQEHLPRLFDRFYRVDESRARDAGGSGLGLSIVKSIVDAHSGQIWVESVVGVGTVVHVVLPCTATVGVPDSSEKRRSLRLPVLGRKRGVKDTQETEARETGIKEGI